MAPLIQPWPLYRLCLSSASQLVDQGCINIYLEHGSYGNQDCVDAIHELQSYLVSSIPMSIFEQLAEERNALARNHNPLLIWSKDPRIKLGLFLHPFIKKFAVDNKGNELMLLQPQDDFYGHTRNGGLDDFFWCAHIKRLVNLVSLNLNLITTDEILYLVGKFCKKLEVVNIVSRIKQDYIQHEPLASLTEESAAIVAGGPNPINQHLPSVFPGITLKFCVSDIGLEALLKCQRLRKITMNKTINHSAMPTNRGITLKGVRKLVKGLPNLEVISFGSMGKILNHNDFEEDEEQISPLRLTYFNEVDPDYVHIGKLAQLCPNIAHLNLSVPITINPSGLNVDYTANGPCVQILNSLAKSKLHLKTVELHLFPYCEAFEAFLISKGPGLQELMFKANNNLNSKNVLFIGQHCPILQKLHIKDLGPEDDPSMALKVSNAAYLSSLNMFSELHTVHVSGRGWNSKVILPIVLLSAFKVTKMSLMNMSSRMCMDAAWHRIFAVNGLVRLQSLSLYSGCFVSIAMVRKMAFDCPKLTFFSFIQSENIELAEVERLKLDVAKKNLNLKVCCLEMFDV